MALLSIQMTVFRFAAGSNYEFRTSWPVDKVQFICLLKDLPCDQTTQFHSTAQSIISEQVEIHSHKLSGDSPDTALWPQLVLSQDRHVEKAIIHGSSYRPGQWET